MYIFVIRKMSLFILFYNNIITLLFYYASGGFLFTFSKKEMVKVAGFEPRIFKF
jgi:hypothetical protein